jgi:hypothetical protein
LDEVAGVFRDVLHEIKINNENRKMKFRIFDFIGGQRYIYWVIQRFAHKALYHHL